jgi:hypothetical protein
MPAHRAMLSAISGLCSAPCVRGACVGCSAGACVGCSAPHAVAQWRPPPAAGIRLAPPHPPGRPRRRWRPGCPWRPRPTCWWSRGGGRAVVCELDRWLSRRRVLRKRLSPQDIRLPHPGHIHAALPRLPRRNLADTPRATKPQVRPPGKTDPRIRRKHARARSGCAPPARSPSHPAATWWPASSTRAAGASCGHERTHDAGNQRRGPAGGGVLDLGSPVRASSAQ